MEPQDIRIVLGFSTDDQAWVRRSSIVVPKYWQGHSVAPATGDAIRIGGRQFIIQGRVWEHDEAFKEYLRKTRAMAIDMETATIFAAGFHNEIPSGALLLVSDQPMIPEGVKTEASDKKVTEGFVDAHVKVGIEALRLIRRHGKSVKHLRFDE